MRKPENATLAQFEEARERAKRIVDEQISNHRQSAWLSGREHAHKVFEAVLRFKEALVTEDRDISRHEHLLDMEFARGFSGALLPALKFVADLIPLADRDDLFDHLASDIQDHAEEALNGIGDEWVSPWMIHAEKLHSEGPNGLKLQFITVGLYQEFHAFDVGRCLTDLDEDFRAVAIAMLESFSRHGRDDPHFVHAAQRLLREAPL